MENHGLINIVITVFIKVRLQRGISFEDDFRQKQKAFL